MEHRITDNLITFKRSASNTYIFYYQDTKLVVVIRNIDLKKNIFTSRQKFPEYEIRRHLKIYPDFKVVYPEETTYEN